MTRQEPALAEPGCLTGFPTCDASGQWRRAHAADARPWLFANRGAGRFDLQPPAGTCYLGSSLEVAVRERLGEALVRAGRVSWETADRIAVSRMSVMAVVADTTHHDAVRFGVTREIDTHTPYQLPQLWAAALHTEGHGGVRYRPRFTTGDGAYALALFGPGGYHGDGDPDPVSGPVALDHVGIAVTSRPSRPAVTDPITGRRTRKDRPPGRHPGPGGV